MNWALLLLSAALVIGCHSPAKQASPAPPTTDPIAELVAHLEDIGEIDLGINPALFLPETSSVHVIVGEVLDSYGVQPDGQQIVEMRNVVIEERNYIAALLEKDRQQRIVLTTPVRPGLWWARLHDVPLSRAATH